MTAPTSHNKGEPEASQAAELNLIPQLSRGCARDSSFGISNDCLGEVCG